MEDNRASEDQGEKTAFDKPKWVEGAVACGFGVIIQADRKHTYAHESYGIKGKLCWHLCPFLAMWKARVSGA